MYGTDIEYSGLKLISFASQRSEEAIIRSQRISFEADPFALVFTELSKEYLEVSRQGTQRMVLQIFQYCSYM